VVFERIHGLIFLLGPVLVLGGNATNFVIMALLIVVLVPRHIGQTHVNVAALSVLLLIYVINDFGTTDLDVNEQNEQAVEFHLHLGCAVIGRAERDGMGKPYPLFHVRLPAPIRITITARRHKG
jgi:hypothetical protein